MTILKMWFLALLMFVKLVALGLLILLACYLFLGSVSVLGAFSAVALAIMIGWDLLQQILNIPHEEYPSFTWPNILARPAKIPSA